MSITGGDQGTCNKAFLAEPNFRPLYIHLEMDHIVNFITKIKINGYGIFYMRKIEWIWNPWIGIY